MKKLLIILVLTALVLLVAELAKSAEYYQCDYAYGSWVC